MEPTIFEKVDHYIADLFAAEDPKLMAVTDQLEQKKIPNASVSPVQGKFLQVMAMACNAQRILELGTLGAYSTIWLARMLPPGGKVVTIECDAEHARVAQANIQNAGLEKMIELRTGSAMEILPLLQKEKAGPFDMIFIDADKPPYTEYFQWALKLSRPGTIIIADNVVRNGKVLDKDSTDEKVKGVQRFNDMLARCEDVTAVVLQTVGTKEYDGMAIAVVKY